MSDLKSQLADLLSIETGKVFKAKLPLGSDKEHFIIIVVVSEDRNYCGYFYVTSKVANAKRIGSNDPESILILNSTDWPILTLESCIQCNKKHLYQTSKSDLIRLCREGNLKIISEQVPSNIKEKILEASNKSKTFTSKDIKNFFKKNN